MRRFIVLTKTSWDEPPRLRHHVARLLAGAGFDVRFFVKPRYPWQAPAPLGPTEQGITLYQHQELVNHRLRLTGAIRAANAAVVRRTLFHALAAEPPTTADVILNFNYEYYFLRDWLPSNRIITFINDDFVDQAPLGYEAPQRWALARTCAVSDHVVTVSPLLDEQVRPYCAPQRFEPWAERPYQTPAAGPRDTLMFWGYINPRIDFDVVRELAARLATERPHIRLLLVGPIERRSEADAESLRRFSNVEFARPAALDDLPLNRVLASIIPYKAGTPAADAIVNPNKAVQILARGIPLLIAGMPHFFQAPFVTRINMADAARQVDALASEFDVVQPAIAAFVARNGASARLRQLLELAG